MFDIVITLDYEIGGDGAGHVGRDVIEPSRKLLDICDAYGAKLTIMFEMAEYWAFRGIGQDEPSSSAQADAEQMQEQAVEAIVRGHDVQLHIHPQWIGASRESGAWKLNLDAWCLADLPRGLGNEGDQLSIRGALSKGKRDLERMLTPVKPDYRCLAFRAGGWCIQPSQEIIAAMKTVGLVADSSVVKGALSRGRARFDFSAAPRNFGYWWTSHRDVCEAGRPRENIVELPILAFPGRPLSTLSVRKSLHYLRTRSRLGKARAATPASKHDAPRIGSRDIFRRFANGYPVKWDLCKLSGRELLRFYERAARHARTGTDGETRIPLVMIGHTKDLFSCRHFEAFLRLACEKQAGRFQFATLQDTVERITSGDRKGEGAPS